MSLVQILLQTSSPYWNNVIQNAIGGTVGSFLAIYASVKIYKWTEKKSQIALIEAIRLTEENQLKAFALMLQEAIKVSKKQFEGINAFISELKEQPAEFPKISINPLGNLKRIVDNITVEETGLAYMKNFPGENAAKEFTNIIDIVDYLYAEFNELQGLVQRATINHYDRKVEVSRTFEYIHKYIIDNYTKLSSIEDIGEKIIQVRTNFDNNRQSLDSVKCVNDLFFKPLNQLMMEVLKKGHLTPFTSDLAYHTSKGMEFYGYVCSGYVKFENEMSAIKDEVNINMNKLEKTALKLLTSNYNS